MFTTPQSAENPGSRASPSPSRRRLLLGAVAALPSVYTLSSGAQTAAASVFNCTLADPPHSLQRFTKTDDKWLRSKVYVGRMKNDNADCVLANQTACVDPLHPGKAADGSVWIHSDQRVIAGPYAKIDQVSTSPKDYGLVYVDRTGTIQTLDPNGNPALQPVVDSCWASMAVSSKSLLG